jgi:hypothetical protein
VGRIARETGIRSGANGSSADVDTALDSSRVKRLPAANVGE